MVESKTKAAAGGGGLVALILIGALVFAFKGKGEETPENGGEGENGGNGGETPGNGSSGGYPDYSMPSALQVETQGPIYGEGSWEGGSYIVTFKTTITNRGDAEGAFNLQWGTNELHAVTSAETFEVEGTQILRLQPGESYNWKYVKDDIPDYYRGYLKCWLFGAWDPNVPAIGVWT
jgi:hypothetical protein